MEKKDFKKGQKAILLSLKNVDFRKTMDIDATTEECTVVKVGRKYITVCKTAGDKKTAAPEQAEPEDKIPPCKIR